MLNSYFYLTMNDKSIVCQQNELDDEKILRAIFLILSRLQRDVDLNMACKWMLESEGCSLEKMEKRMLAFKHLMKESHDSELLLEFDVDKINIKANTKIVGMFVSIVYLYTSLNDNGVIKKNLHQDMITNGIENIKRHLNKEALEPERMAN